MIGIQLIKRSLPLCLAVFFCVGLASAAFAFGPGSGMHGMEWRMLRQLDLTDAQKTQIETIMDTYRPQMDSLRENKRQTCEDKMAGLAGLPFDEAQARQMFQEMASVQEEMFVLRMRVRSEIRAVLTEAQIQQLEAKKDRCRDDGMREKSAFRHGKMKAMRGCSD